jgi:hypothetical protein
MGMKFFGCTGAQNIDNTGEVLDINGCDISKLKTVKDEHPDEDTCFSTIGAITMAKKIFSEKDCSSPRELRTWKQVGVPLIYVEGELADDDHPNAAAATALVKFTQRPDIPLNVGLSIDGGILERTDKDGNADAKGTQLTKTVALAASFTVKPANSKCFLSPINDLTKSDLTAEPPLVYWEALKKSQALRSFNEIQGVDFQLYLKVSSLKKSLKDYFGGFTSTKCKKCGTGVKFFKSTQDFPNGCTSCGSPFSMSDIWKSLNK